MVKKSNGFLSSKSSQVETKKSISTIEADKLLKEHHETHDHFKDEESKKTKKTSKSAKKKKTNRKK